ncbi:hypothetical protein [Actinotalea sp. K2]|uniref:hypothetical protein n=1 Tax=Actinotalea sp. K2 TaxID=2939438 RepID=UPI0020174880|nr:hypothetical protein [Actinotalea sp. K2]MCL3862938.1 hypothetical protein [Actinotalea sp. K2]
MTQATAVHPVSPFADPQLRPEPHDVLTASLRVLVLPLSLALRRKRFGDPRPQGPKIFLPGRAEEATANDRPTDAAFDSYGVPTDGSKPMDVGFGTPTLLFSTLHEVPDVDPVSFGTSASTLDELTDSEVEQRLWTGRPAVCVSLWATDAVPVLTVERVAPHTDDDGLTCEVGSHVDNDVLGALGVLTEGTPWAYTMTLEHLFGTRAARKLVGRRQAEADIRTLRCRSSERIRGRSVTEGLYAILVPGGTTMIEEITGRETDDQQAQESGAPWTWTALELADRPAEPGAASALRSDSRVAVVNLESLSPRHDYTSVSGAGLLVSTLPVVAHRAQAEDALVRLSELVSSTVDHKSSRFDAQLEALETARVTGTRTKIAQRFASPENSSEWTYSTSLASELTTRTDTRLNELADDLETFAAAAQAQLERVGGRRRDRIDRILRVVSPVAAFSALIGLYATIATLPGTGTTHLLDSVPDAAWLTAILVAAGVVVGVLVEPMISLWHRLSRRGDHPRR